MPPKNTDNSTCVNFEPKEYGSPIINIKCSRCGAMFSERDGHTCGEDDYY